MAIPYNNPKTVVSTAWLGNHLHDPDLRILDGSWYLPNSGRNGREEYDREHIVGARYFDIDEIADLSTDLPHMAPDPAKFASRMREMGVGDGHQVIVYDGPGYYSSARVWWLFRLMGHFDVAVLDGGFRKWTAEGRPTEDMPPVIQERHKTAIRQSEVIKTAEQVDQARKSGSWQIVDARSPGRFRGLEPEPRAGLRAGRIPGSVNLCFQNLIRPDGTLKSRSELQAAFDEAGVDLGRPVISTCGSGVTAGVIDLALEILGHRRHAVYDGSWSEWGTREEFEVETG